MDPLSLAGLLLGVLAIVLGQQLEGGHFSSILQPTAALIVIGGTTGATMLSASSADVRRGLGMIGQAFSKRPARRTKLMASFTQFAEIARKDGIIELEDHIERHSDAFFRRAIRCVVDGMPSALLREVLETEAQIRLDDLRAAAKIYDTAGGYAPTMGILGAVLGLVHVMENLDDPTALGGGIAVAFVATIYGVGLANLILIPIGAKLRRVIAEHEICEEMVIEGALALESGQNARAVRERLDSFLAAGP